MKIILNSETIKNIYKHVKILLFAIFVNKLVHFAIFENSPMTEKYTANENSARTVLLIGA